jgi:hypothetical protein
MVKKVSTLKEVADAIPGFITKNPGMRVINLFIPILFYKTRP